MSPSVPVNCASRFISGVGGVVNHMDLEPKSHEIKMKTLGVNFLLAPHLTQPGDPSHPVRPSIYFQHHGATSIFDGVMRQHHTIVIMCYLSILSLEWIVGVFVNSHKHQNSYNLFHYSAQYLFSYLTSLSSCRSSSSLSIQMCLSPSLSSQD